MFHPRAIAGLLALLFAVEARAGLYYSGETYNELPSQWRGFLLDQRMLRNIAIRPMKGTPASTARKRYEQAAVKLEKAARERKLTADESADLGALYVRLGEPAKAVEVLRAAQRTHDKNFRIAANLGTAWQLQGDLDQAAAALEQAVRLAPGKLQKAEEYQLKLVRLRRKQPKTAQDLDDLFGIRYVADGDKYEPGKLAATQRKKLPSEATAIVQQLALWLPADPRLLWQLAELANAHGDVRTAAAIMDGCAEFGLRADDLRQHRRATRAAADALAAKKTPDAKSEHEGGHGVAFKPKSSRPLATKIDQTPLPPIDATGVNALPWSVITDTTVDKHYKPTFPKYLKELTGKQITLTGYMQPLGTDTDCASFMFIENPVGCWFCEMPDITGIIFVELPRGKTKPYTRGPIKVTGKLRLNDSDPENFLYTIGEAQVVDGE
jgi:tetratricopeptide (TPR) repeat protein